MLVAIKCIAESKPGKQWKKVFNRTWPYYKNWFLQEGLMARPGYLSCLEALDHYMPELVPVYEELCSLVGGGDLASRYLALYNPPPFMSGCTQVVWVNGEPMLVRNYDYNPKWFEGVMLKSNWLQPVIGISDCNWGVLDGMNSHGLAVSLTFGGSQRSGRGFGIPLIIRYLLETQTTVDGALKALHRLPVHMSYNLLLLDAGNNFATVYLGPDRTPGVYYTQVCSNHQEHIEWPEYATMTQTIERETVVNHYLQDEHMTARKLIKKFLQPPLHNARFEQSFGTLYTSAWYPASGKVKLLWKHKEVVQSFDHFESKKIIAGLKDHFSVNLTK